MKRVHPGLLLVAAVALSALPAPLLGALMPRGYWVVLRLEGFKDGLVVDGRELCRDVVGSVVVKLGAEFHSIDLCELLGRREVKVGFEEGVREWRRLEELE